MIYIVFPQYKFKYFWKCVSVWWKIGKNKNIWLRPGKQVVNCLHFSLLSSKAFPQTLIQLCGRSPAAVSCTSSPHLQRITQIFYYKLFWPTHCFSLASNISRRSPGGRWANYRSAPPPPLLHIRMPGSLIALQLSTCCSLSVLSAPISSGFCKSSPLAFLATHLVILVPTSSRHSLGIRQPRLLEKQADQQSREAAFPSPPNPIPLSHPQLCDRLPALASIHLLPPFSGN